MKMRAQLKIRRCNAGPELRRGLGGTAPPPLTTYNGSRALPTNKKKEKRIYKIFPECDQDPLGNNPLRDDYRPPAQFLVHVAAMCAAVPPPKLRVSSGLDVMSSHSGIRQTHEQSLIEIH